MRVGLESPAIFRQLPAMVKARCDWCGDDPLYVRYHDREWGIPARDPQALFELLMVEGMQAGLSWITILRKRRRMHEVFDAFDPMRLARWRAREIDSAMSDPGIIRHRGKIEAVVGNARAFLEFDDPKTFFWSFVDGAPVQNRWRTIAQVPSSTPTAEAMSKALKQRGFKFVGPTICYAFMQAGGLINDHLTGCFRHDSAARARRCLVI
jgi:DNA-3-methyladenine glycosylase I